MKTEAWIVVKDGKFLRYLPDEERYDYNHHIIYADLITTQEEAEKQAARFNGTVRKVTITLEDE